MLVCNSLICFVCVCVCFVLVSKHSLVLTVSSLPKPNTVWVHVWLNLLKSLHKIVLGTLLASCHALSSHIHQLVFCMLLLRLPAFLTDSVFWCLPHSYQFAASLVFIVVNRNVTVQHYEKRHSLKLGDGIQEMFVGAHPQSRRLFAVMAYLFWCAHIASLFPRSDCRYQ